MDNVNRDNFRVLLAHFMNEISITSREVAAAIGCSEMTVRRLLDGRSLPSDEMLKQGGIMFDVDFDWYRKLSKAEKEKLSEAIGSVGGGVLGFGSITAAVSASGSVAGLSAAGISSGLASLGALVGGGMAAGIAVAATIPILAGAAGYGLIKGVKYIFREMRLNDKDRDPDWEQ